MPNQKINKKILIILFGFFILVLLAIALVSVRNRFVEKPAVSIVLDKNQTVYDSRTKWASVHLKRGEDNVELERIDFFFLINNKEEKFTVDKQSIQSILKTNSEKVYKFDLSRYEDRPSRVKVSLISKGQEKLSLITLLTFSYRPPEYIQTDLSEGFVLPQWCFLELAIEETKTDQGIQFSLLSAETSVGFYQNALVDIHYEGEPVDYILRVYDSASNLLGSYSLYSSRFIFWDNFGEDAETNPGGIIERDTGIISVVIPYNPNIRTAAIETRKTAPLPEATPTPAPTPGPTYFNINASGLECEM